MLCYGSRHLESIVFRSEKDSNVISYRSDFTMK